MVDVIFSAVVKDVLILFPESDAEIETERERKKGEDSVNFIFLGHHLGLKKMILLLFLWFYLPRF